MANPIVIPIVEGISSRQAHTDLPNSSYERELGRDGFYGPATQMYHRHPPTSWDSIDGPLKPRAFDLNKNSHRTLSPWNAIFLLSNSHTSVRYWRTSEKMDQLVRNADGDDLLFFHQGNGDFYCDYGHMPYSSGEYLLLPRGTSWRIEPQSLTEILMIEASNDRFGLPDKGLLGQHAIFDPAVLVTPKLDEKFKQQDAQQAWSIAVKRHGEISYIHYLYNPLDCIGWHGTLCPVKLDTCDIRPLMSHRYHLPPSVHTTFLSKRFVVCTFCPRPMESDPGALKVPFFHNNDDYDEVIFYHRGDFFSRDNIHPGMMTLHPSGITHGPHPKALHKSHSNTRDHTDEIAVMIDARDPLTIESNALDFECHDYVNSWKSNDNAL